MTQQRAKAANLSTGKSTTRKKAKATPKHSFEGVAAKRYVESMVVTITHADYPQRLCVAIDPVSGITHHHLVELVWLLSCANAPRLNALLNSTLFKWMAEAPPGSYTPYEVEQLIALINFTSAMAAIKHVG